MQRLNSDFVDGRSRVIRFELCADIGNASTTSASIPGVLRVERLSPYWIGCSQIGHKISKKLALSPTASHQLDLISIECQLHYRDL